MNSRSIRIVIVLLTVTGSSRLSAVDDVAGTLFTLTNTATAPNGAWSWFQDERAIVDATDPDNPLLLVSSVSAAADGHAESGDVDLLWRNLNTGEQGEFELHHRLERDDHDAAALYLRPDGRYLAMYSRHGNDNLTRWRISSNPHDPSQWGPMQTLDNGAGTTYDNIYHLSEDNNGAGRTYNFTRATLYDPVVQVSNDHGSSWTYAGKLLTEGGGGDRPYVRYASDGKRIHFISTERHPAGFQNSVFHGYIEDGVLYDTHGATIDANLFDATGVTPALLTPIFKNGTAFGDTTMHRAWTISMEIDNTGNPVGIFSARANDSSADHRFFYARFDGDTWKVNEMARAGGFLYAAEADYTGLASIDPDNPNVVFMSSKIDPRSESQTSKYELYRGITSDFGQSWSWSAITENSTMDNIRPVVPKWNGLDTAVAWLRGTYTTYTNWNTEIVGLRLADEYPKALLWRGDADNPSYWDVSVTANWDSGGDVVDSYHQGDEVAFDDSALSHQVELREPVSPMGVAFNNAATPYTLTGAGISGNGGLRIIGGGTVTLVNSPNTYTGETLVARGTLALAGGSSLAETSHIRIKSQGTFDVSALTNAPYSLSGQLLTVEGHVIGDFSVTNSSAVEISSSGVVSGNLEVADSLLSAEGRLAGNLMAQAGSVVRVGQQGITVQATLGPAVYIDASSGVGGNTTFVNGAVFSPPLNGTTGSDNAWEQRTVLGSHGNIFESGGEAPENAPELKTTITGLTPGGNYNVSVLFWDANGEVEDWNIRTGFSSGDMTFFANGTTSDAAQLGATGAQLASSFDYASSPTLFTESNRTLLAGNVGEAVANENGVIAVYIDDMPSPIGANNRTWYDGLALREVFLPTEQLIKFEIGGDFVQQAGSTLEIDIYSPAVRDQLSVEGHLIVAGTLQVSLAPGAPSPQLGDQFDILRAENFAGEFNEYHLPVLDEGLAWNISQLLSSGTLEVVRDVDLDNDGDVDGRDFLAIQRTMPSLIPDWQALYGSRVLTSLSVLSIAVPEPAACTLVCLVSATSAMMRVRQMAD